MPRKRNEVNNYHLTFSPNNDNSKKEKHIKACELKMTGQRYDAGQI